ncbi:hypothetical protein Patl1_18241 [Pistacia atlantica]|uniref:Uncharacterized protein n=1 Tax=Pistacia atlantica TaxID=434234 RepID=A0ACC1C0D7_9ROSI|nr:hypothetical protein Patl1_18241 [Pistacia atlantica]
MQIQTISRETIKPASPTPDHLRKYKLSVLDQLCPEVHFPIILFYSSPGKDTAETSLHLKNSLSKILTLYYPFAGRVKDDYTVDCNDNGALFIEAKVSSQMSDILKRPEKDVIKQLLPYKIHEKIIGDPVNLSVQVNYFACGGIAIGVGFNHRVADATAAANFVKNWAKVANPSNNEEIKNVIFDCTSFFPPQDLVELRKSSLFQGQYASTDPNVISKRFTFEAAKIAALKEEIGKIADSVDRPSRFEAVSAVMLNAITAMTKDPAQFVGFIPVNLRNRMKPEIPGDCMGCVSQMTMANWSNMETGVGSNSIAGDLHEAIKMMDDNFVREFHASGGYMNFVKSLPVEEMAKNNIKMKSFVITSWCRLPWYETDFGWGKPLWMWVSSAARNENIAILTDNIDGDGIDAWVGLSKEDMIKFEQDPGIKAYASFEPTKI